MEIIVQVKNVYGNQMIYPACEKSEVFAKIAGKKTLSKTDLMNIEFLGYTVTIQPQVLAA